MSSHPHHETLAFEPMTETFSPEGYRDVVDNIFPEGVRFYLTNIHNVVNSGKFKGSKCIEIGCGPTIYSLASASKYYDYIVTSDYLDVNRQFVKRWLQKDPSHPGYSDYMKFIAGLEGYSDLEKGQAEIEARLRKSVKAIVHCDVTKEEMLPRDKMQEYDLLITSLTLEAACSDWEAFGKAARNLAKIIRRGGGFVMMGVTECSYWVVGNHKYHSLKMNEKDIKKHLSDAGFGNFSWSIIAKETDAPETANNEDTYFLVAEKL